MNQELIKAGEIAKQVKTYARTIIKKDVLLLEIAEKIEDKIRELGGKPAFATTLCINDIAAHATPAYNDETKAHGLLKVDLGVHVNGYLSDTAFSLDLEDNEENKKLIKAAEHALENAIKVAVKDIEINQIGKAIQTTIESYDFNPIVNLSGHSLEKYELHSGITIPNIDDGRDYVLEEGTYAIEPFSTNGGGKVYDGRPSGIYILQDEKNVRSPIAREILNFIIDEYRTLPFCSRWLVKKFGTKALLGLRQLQENGNLHHFDQLTEASHGKVAQAEHTIIVEKDKTIITT